MSWTKFTFCSNFKIKNLETLNTPGLLVHQSGAAAHAPEPGSGPGKQQEGVWAGGDRLPEHGGPARRSLWSLHQGGGLHASIWASVRSFKLVRRGCHVGSRRPGELKSWLLTECELPCHSWGLWFGLFWLVFGLFCCFFLLLIMRV